MEFFAEGLSTAKPVPPRNSSGYLIHVLKGEVRFEIPVEGYNAEPLNGVTDYCLYRSNGEVIAIVSWEKQNRAPWVAQQQALHYVMEIAKHQSFQQREAYRQAEHLFQTDLHRAFQEELQVGSIASQTA